MPGAPDEDDFFGGDVTSSDFDRDSYADLAVGNLGEDSTTSVADAGAVTDVYGSIALQEPSELIDAPGPA